LVLPKEKATIQDMKTTPWKFILTESEDEDENGAPEFEEATGT
jgi:hypothetical protein